MKVQTNIRAGAQTRKKSSSTDSVDVTPVYVPPVSRCVGV